VKVTDAAPYHLLADLSDFAPSIRRTRAGDAWDAAQAASCAVPSVDGATSGSINLGLPIIRKA
jgi:tRNA-2-methylthio-N6-dimethylallyladenosine synthase